MAELYERAALVDELHGPQIEAWVSGLFPLFDGEVTVEAFASYCATQQTERAALICLALAELTEGLDAPETTAMVRQAAAIIDGGSPDVGAQIGTSTLDAAWLVEAPFGRTIVLGYENAHMPSLADPDGEPIDAAHSILIEISSSGELEDLQLTGPPRVLLDEAATADERVRVTVLDREEALARVVSAWPTADEALFDAGPGVSANQQFVRRRILMATGSALPVLSAHDAPIDISRGLDPADYAEANRAALSTLLAAQGEVHPDPHNAVAQLWAAVIRGDGGDVSPRERGALLWLEWADWLGVGIGLLRAGEGCSVSGELFVDLVNQCPEVSSTIDKADRDYAAWAFDIALDLLGDGGAVESGTLTAEGYRALGPAMLLAWGPSA